MRNIKLTIEYDGTHFNGWQVQTKGKRTVQGEIEKALRIIYKKKIRLIGSGRTDSGVHALGQAAHFKTDTGMTTSQIIRALNANLPEDIVILKAQEVTANFHAQHSAKRKTYQYRILNRDVRCAQQRQFHLYFPCKLNARVMREEAKALVGRKDFRSFMASDPKRDFSSRDGSTIRTIYQLNIRKTGPYLIIDIEANGFLYKMIRNIVGTLLDIGTGKSSKGSIREIQRKKNRFFAGDTAPAKGLCLLHVTY